SQAGTFAKLTKSEALERTREMESLERPLGGVTKMGGLPDAFFVHVVDPGALELTESNTLGISAVSYTNLTLPTT
ncbi:30S ribosomal protein S2, partial [Acinetobacter baumannii]|uniref:30S ribosomal protein S2 n=1 Tax=Acinetobacter baumannii TaxID=470 RepID=UPI001146FC3B